ncbi:MAG: malto-oligosyltrehalose trehalohydrolase [Burkholderiales bacterium]|nr:malto-oligosyltrehalose trehalohydrolase [Burkholderiales bacterium]PZN04220.1 MAG: malto-oligosyltrehalose trehalohydrolase [Pseudomonadota bacterium]
MKRRHLMPFGTQLLEGGGVRFRLWAPSARHVDLVLAMESGRAELPMRAAEDGWYETVVANASVGARYAYRIDGGISVPDPAARFNPEDVHAPSEIVDPFAYEWQDGDWRGRPWEEAVLYELHVGTFTPVGTYAAAMEKLDYLVDLGVTAIELMPVAEFPGKRNWGYDGALLFAPNANYGRPEDLKRFIDAAHARGLMVFLDVVYNHFGPEGNYLHIYAESFFNPRHQTPWGAAINYDGPDARTVRSFFIHNALYWLEEYHFDGLRLDAVHTIADDSQPHILQELAEAVHTGPGRDRHVHLVLENERNEARYLGRDADHRPLVATAQWNDDFHHAVHVLLTGEGDGYYQDYSDKPLAHLGRCLAEGFAYQHDVSRYGHGRLRGEPSVHLPATAFVNFIQNHDQVGNRAFGERIGHLAPPEAVEAAAACYLLAPGIPMLFMGEEFDASAPFLFFCDFGPDLSASVTAGRRGEFSRFERFKDPETQRSIPDPVELETFERSKLRWHEVGEARHAARLALYRQLLALRHRHIVPRLRGITPSGSYVAHERAGLHVQWTLGDGARLELRANLRDTPAEDVTPPVGTPIYCSPSVKDPQLRDGRLPPWSVVWSLQDGPTAS